MKKISKKEAESEINNFFNELQNKKPSPSEIKKIKRLAMNHNIKLREKRKKFCKKCYSIELRVKSIKNKIKTTECKNCGGISRWKINR